MSDQKKLLEAIAAAEAAWLRKLEVIADERERLTAAIEKELARPVGERVGGAK